MLNNHCFYLENVFQRGGRIRCMQTVLQSHYTYIYLFFSFHLSRLVKAFFNRLSSFIFRIFYVYIYLVYLKTGQNLLIELLELQASMQISRNVHLFLDQFFSVWSESFLYIFYMNYILICYLVCFKSTMRSSVLMLLAWKREAPTDDGCEINESCYQNLSANFYLRSYGRMFCMIAEPGPVIQYPAK